MREKHGVLIPADCFFLGGFHDTSSEMVVLFDVERVPETHRSEFERARTMLNLARGENAVERCAKFMLAPGGLATFPRDDEQQERESGADHLRDGAGYQLMPDSFSLPASQRGNLFEIGNGALSHEPTIDDVEAGPRTGGGGPWDDTPLPGLTPSRDPKLHAQALNYVATKCFDLGEARPELGHATNAAVIIGGRYLTRGLFHTFSPKVIFVPSSRISPTPNPHPCDASSAHLIAHLLRISHTSLTHLHTHGDSQSQ